MPRTHPPYPPEFRSEAVHLAKGSDKSIPALAADLGVSSEPLRHWLRQADADAGRGQPGDVTTEEREELRRLRRENQVLKQEGEILKKPQPSSRRRPHEPLSAHPREKAAYPITLLCRVLGVASSAYYAWARRGVSARVQADADLAAQIAAAYARSSGTYGAPRVHAALRAAGVCTSRRRVARLMRAGGLMGCRRHHRTRTTVVDPARPPAANVVARDFAAPASDRLWLGDITYVATHEGWLYLAVLLDAHSRRVIG